MKEKPKIDMKEYIKKKPTTGQRLNEFFVTGIVYRRKKGGD